MERVVGHHYRLIKKLGAGSFGETFQAENTRNHNLVAVKLEETKTRAPQLSYESKIYAILAGGTGIPKLFWYGTENQQNILVIELLGSSLETLHEKCHKFSLKTVLMLADQMISCVEYLHQKNFIHRDIKPDNLVMGNDSKKNQLHLIDFGLCRKYRDQHTHKHIPYIENKPMTGTARYASLNAMKGIEQSRRDDLEAIGYVLMYFLRGDLPWMGITARTQSEKFHKICQMKEKITFEELCKGYPSEFVTYFKKVRNLEFDEKPNYAELRYLFRRLFIRSRFVFDYKYDWDCPEKQKVNTRNVVINSKNIVNAVPKNTIANAKQVSSPNLIRRESLPPADKPSVESPRPRYNRRQVTTVQEKKESTNINSSPKFETDDLIIKFSALDYFSNRRSARYKKEITPSTRTGGLRATQFQESYTTRFRTSLSRELNLNANI